MRRIVDASALLDALLPTTHQRAALKALQGHDLWAPHILDLEVSSALWRLERTDQITSAEAEQAFEVCQTSPIRRIADPAIARAAWRLRHALRISDAFYVATARAVDGDLVTSDARLSRTPTLGVSVTLLR